MKAPTPKTKVPIFTFIVFFALGFVVHVLIAYMRPVAHASTVQVEPVVRETGKYKFIAPLLLCATYESTDFDQTASLQSDIKKIVDSEIKSGKADNVSVYMRGFKGKWVGINENEAYAPASLLKVPLMIAFFKKAENQPEILDTQVMYDGTFDNNQGEEFRSPNDIKPGRYTILQLIKSMILNSDNNATYLLNTYIDPDSLASVYTDLGLAVPTGKGATVQIISAKQYSYFFRILYNATYLSPEYSELALNLLSGTDFPQGLESTVPVGTPVANKFGERTVFTPNGEVVERNLHDCGIVYATNGSYLLCIMTKGKNFADLTEVIQTIGKLVYKRSLDVTQ